ncbi:PfkB family carbohydrate kinase, partial [Bacillus paranthracis]
QLEEDVLATGVIGGTLGDFINQELKKAGIKNDFLKTEKESRNCIAILHEGMQTEILESGPTLSLKEGKAFLDKFEGLLSKTSFVTISGSLPKGLPDDFYHQMLVISHKKDVPVILDSSGESLKQVLLHKEKPFAIKPN